jgi:hypothetical protein
MSRSVRGHRGAQLPECVREGVRTLPDRLHYLAVIGWAIALPVLLPLAVAFLFGNP